MTHFIFHNFPRVQTSTDHSSMGTLWHPDSLLDCTSFVKDINEWEKLLLSFFDCLFLKTVCSNRYLRDLFYFAPAVCYAGYIGRCPSFIAISLKAKVLDPTRPIGSGFEAVGSSMEE